MRQIFRTALLIVAALPAIGQTAGAFAPIWADVRTFGAACDGKSDDTTAFAAAMQSSHAVVIPPSTCVISSITVPSGTTLRGAGKAATILLQKAGSVGPVIGLKSTSQNIEVADLTINGNADRQVRPNHGVAILNEGNAPNGGIFAGNHFTLRDIYVAQTAGDCFYLDSPSGVDELHDLSGFRCGGRGLYANIADSAFSDLDFGSTGLEGIYCGGGCANDRFVGAKVWFTGGKSHPSLAHGSGVYLQGERNEFSAIETQNTAGDGIFINLGTGNILDSVRVESPGSSGIIEGQATAGIRFRNAHLNHVSAFIGNGQCGAKRCTAMTYALEFDSDGVRATSHGNIVSAVVAAPLKAAVDVSDGYASKLNSIVTASAESASGTPQQWGTVVPAVKKNPDTGAQHR